MNDRGESFLSDAHGRDQQSHVTLALNAEGDFLALRVDSVGSVGPYLLSVGPFTCTGGSARTQGGPYRIPALHFHARAAFTNTAPTDPYRGAGRPEATYHIERIIDLAAAQIGMDRVALRRRNLLAADELPYTTGAGARIDCGDFEAIAGSHSGRSPIGTGFEARANGRRGPAAGAGASASAIIWSAAAAGPRSMPHSASPVTAAPPWRWAVTPPAWATRRSWRRSSPRAWALPLESIDFRAGRHRCDPHRRRPRRLAGPGDGRIRGGGHVVERVLEKATRIAAHVLEAAGVDVEFHQGRFRVAGTDHGIDHAGRDSRLIRCAAAPRGHRQPWTTPSITSAAASPIPTVATSPRWRWIPRPAASICMNYSIVDDFGTILNPLTCAGQVMGGTAQGIGQALMEKDRLRAGQRPAAVGFVHGLRIAAGRGYAGIPHRLLRGRAQREPTRLGAKGAGEAGCCGALPAVVGAVMHALEEYGVRHLDMPLDPEKVWRAIHTGGEPGSGAA